MANGVRVAFQGELGAFSEEAVRAYFGGRIDPLPCREVRDVGAAVSSGSAEYGLLPVENTLAGTVVATFDLLAVSALRVIGEVIRPIDHCVVGVRGAPLDRLVRLLSHPVALAQCGRFLARHPWIEAVAVYDTAGAAREVATKRDRTVGAIAARAAAERYDLAVLAMDVQDRSDNQTRFLVVTRSDRAAEHQAEWATDRQVPQTEGASTHAGAGSEGPRKTLLIVETEDRPGSLLSVLEPFAAGGVNLCHLQSRPAGTPWTYRFFLEIEADAAEPSAAEALETARKRSAALRVVGSFARAASD